MFSIKTATTAVAAVFCLCYCDASFGFSRSGWLDRVVQYRKKEFINEVQDILPPIQIKATIVSKPPGYVDSTAWDYDSVIRLLILIRESESTKDLHRYLRRALRPSRRMWMNKYQSYKYFPSLTKKEDIYYDDSSHEGAIESWEMEEDDDKERTFDDDSIVIVSNPVESKLPSAQISVRLLKDILMARAEAAREMPTTQKSTYAWKPMNKTTEGSGTDATGSEDTGATDSANENGAETPAGGGDATEAGGDATGGGDDAAGGDATPAVEAAEGAEGAEEAPAAE